MNTIFTLKKGFGMFGAVIALALIFIGGGIWYYTSKNARQGADIQSQEQKGQATEGRTPPAPGSSDHMMKDDSMMRSDEGAMLKFSGAVLAGSKAQLLDFNKADYDKATMSGKLVVLYFYANWCSECKIEFPKTQEAFNKLDTGAVIGFRVNFNDNETDADEKALAREHGVAYQHTKVFVKNGVRTLKAPDGWDTNRYLSEINKALGI